MKRVFEFELVCPLREVTAVSHCVQKLEVSQLAILRKPS